MTAISQDRVRALDQTATGIRHPDSKITAKAQSGCRVAKAKDGVVRPTTGCLIRKHFRVLRFRETAQQHHTRRKLPHQHIGRNSSHVEKQQLFFEPSYRRLVAPLLDLVEISIVNVDSSAIDVQPRTPVHDATSPPTNLRHDTIPASTAQIFWLKPASVVDRKIPITIRGVAAQGTRATQHHGFDRWQVRKLLAEFGLEADIVHRLSIARWPIVERARIGAIPGAQ